MDLIRSKFLWFIAALLVAVAVLSNVTNIITEAWWFDAVQFSSVFWTILSWKAIVWIGAFIIYGLFLWLNFRIANRLTRDRPFRTFEGANFRIPGQRIFNIVVGVAILIFSFLAASATLPWWETVLKFLNASAYGTPDPIYGRDIGFYLFKLPFLNGIQSWLLTLFVLGLILSGVVYFLKGAVEFVRSRSMYFSRGAKTHLSILLAVVAVLISLGFWLDRFDLLFSTGGVVFGAGFTDAHARLLSYWLMSILTLGVALVFIISLFRKGITLLVGGVGVFIVSLIVINGLYPWFQQQFVVEPNELQKEKPYIKHNIDYTRFAYGLDDVEREDYPVRGELTQEILNNNQPTIQNIRLWDSQPLLSTYRQIQEIRLYYKFSDADFDRYLVNGDYRQVMISARELSYNQVPSRAKTWQNQRLTYTHGYGVALSPVNEVSQAGLPKLFIKDIPPVSTVDIQVEQPGIYYGEETNHYVFTGTKAQEFDYPMGDENKFTTYDGKGGVEIPGLFQRLLYAYQYGSLKILISGYFTENSKIHYHRNIRKRVENVAPFLRYDRDPYIAIVEGELKWIIDAYTISSEFPYAEPMQGSSVNYIRNSVKVVVDAFDGTMKFYVVDEEDPVLRTYEKIFPDLFTDLSEASPELVDNFRYPIDLFIIQSKIYQSYHMTDPEVFYNQEDMWRFPTQIYEGNEVQMEPYYVIMRLPGSTEEEFLLIMPFTPVNKSNMIAWMTARSDGEHYGKLLLYEFPKKELIFGPRQIEARIDQHPEISELLTLWSQEGSRVIRGDLLVIPIEGALLYVEPVYIRADQGQMPELKRVIVGYQDNIAMRETLEASLAAIFGEAEAVEPLPQQPQVQAQAEAPQLEDLNIPSMVRSALETYQEAQNALQQGDWTAYGEQQQRLQELLQQLQNRTQPGESPE